MICTRLVVDSFSATWIAPILVFDVKTAILRTVSCQRAVRDVLRSLGRILDRDPQCHYTKTPIVDENSEPATQLTDGLLDQTGRRRWKRISASIQSLVQLRQRIKADSFDRS